MVLGFILYESMDIVYNVGKISYNGVKGVYNWYYDVKTEDQQEIERLDRLEDKIDKISKLFEDENLKNKIQQLNLKIKNKN
jgi:hypothetical protein